MKPEAFDALKRTDDGRTVVTLMTDPDMEGGFLSLVQRGANGRRITVAKADDQPFDGADSPNGATAPGSESWWRRLFGPLLGLATAKKADGPTTFDAAISVPRVWDNLWTGQDALRAVIRNVLEDDTIEDKAAKIGAALDGFKAYMLESLADVGTVKKAEDRTALAGYVRAHPATDRATVEKAGRVISAANMERVKTAIAAAQALGAALPDLVSSLRELEDAGTVTTKGESPHEEIDAMTLQQIAAAAGDSAREQARKAGLPADQVEQIGRSASLDVFKAAAAVGGPPQPAMPSDTLAAQRAQAGPEGAGSVVESKLLSAINSGAGSTVTKSADPGAQVEQFVELVYKVAREVMGEDLAGGPSLRDVVVKHDEILGLLAGTPAPSQAAGDPAEPTTVQKDGDADPLASTALGFALS